MAIQQALMVLGVVPPGYETYTASGSHSFIVPPGFTEVSVVSVGGGAGALPTIGGSGGGLVWSDNVSVIPGEVLDINVGVGGTGGDTLGNQAQQGQTTYIRRQSNGEYIVKSYGGGGYSQSNRGGGGEFFAGNGRVLDGGDGYHQYAPGNVQTAQHSISGASFKTAPHAGSQTNPYAGGGTSLISGQTGSNGGATTGNTGEIGGQSGGGGGRAVSGGIGAKYGGNGGNGGVSIAWGAPYLIGDGFPRVDGNYSTYFRGNQYDDYFDYTPGTTGAFQVGTGNFTIEFWHRTANVDPNGNTGGGNAGRQRSFAVFIEGYKASPLVSQTWAIQANSQGEKMIWIEGGNLAFETSLDTMTNASLNYAGNKWHHYAFVRNGNTIDYYVDGFKYDSYTTSLNDTQTDRIRIGNWTANTDYNIHGWMSNVRVTKGVAVYTTPFDAFDKWNLPNEVALLPPLTEITGTSLLDFNSTSLNTAYWGPGNATGTVSQTGGPTSSTESPYS